MNRPARFEPISSTPRANSAWLNNEGKMTVYKTTLQAVMDVGQMTLPSMISIEATARDVTAAAATRTVRKLSQ